MFATPPHRLILPDKTQIAITHVFTSEAERAQGLSGVKPQDFGPFDGALFVFSGEAPRSFWMPDTYFDLDIIFLNGNFKILHIERNVAHHPSREGKIPRVPPHRAQYVLEIKGRTELSRKLKGGMVLRSMIQLDQ